MRVFTPADIQVFTRLFCSGLCPTFDLRRIRSYSSYYQLIAVASVLFSPIHYLDQGERRTCLK